MQYFHGTRYLYVRGISEMPIIYLKFHPRIVDILIDIQYLRNMCAQRAVV